MKCSLCQHLGDAAFPSSRIVNGKLTLIGYGASPNGEPVENPARKCGQRPNIVVYDTTDLPCKYWEPKTWSRPDTCGECQFHGEPQGGKVRCQGHPFCGLHAVGDRACINGQMADGRQMTIFDYMT